MLVPSTAKTPTTKRDPVPTAVAGGPLRIPDFRLLCITQIATGLRMPMLFIAQAWYVNQVAPEDQRLLLLGLLGALRGLPFLAWVLFGGAFADRYPRRTMLIIAHMFAFVATVFTGALLFLPGAAEGEGAWMWVMLGLFTTFGLINAQDMPTRNALIASIVPPSMLTSSVTLFEMSMAIAMIVGGSIAGLLVDGVGFGTTYLLASTAHLVVLVAMLRMRSGQAAADRNASQESVLRNIRSGLGYLRGDAIVRWIVVLSWVVFIFGMTVLTLLVPPWISDVLEADASAWGVMWTSWNVGGALIASALLTRGEFGRKGPLFLASTTTFALATLAFGLSRNLAAATVIYGIAGASSHAMRTAGGAAIQHAVPNRLLGRVVSLMGLAQGASQIAALGTGAVGQVVGLELLFPLAGVLVLMFTLATVALQRPLRALN